MSMCREATRFTKRADHARTRRESDGPALIRFRGSELPLSAERLELPAISWVHVWVQCDRGYSWGGFGRT